MVEEDVKVKRNKNHPDLTIQDVGGRDFLTKPVLLTKDGNFIISCQDFKIYIFSSQTGLPVKSINTNKILSIALSERPGEVVVAGLRSVTVWNYEETKVVEKFKYRLGGRVSWSDLQTVFLPNNFTTSGDVYLTFLNKTQNNFVRVNVREKNSNVIFKNVTIDSQHIGDNDNSIVSLSNHKVPAMKNTSFVCYDRNIAKVQCFQADSERPLTIVRCHPAEKTIAVGDTSGRILIFAGIDTSDELKPAKSILHWHSLPVTGLSWSLEGGHLFSGGGERVLCKWFPEAHSKPTFLPRLGSDIIGIVVSESNTALKLQNNSVLILDRQDKPSGELAGLCKNSSGWPAGLSWDSRAKTLLLNGNVGHVQVFNPLSKDTYSIDITRQNYLTKEREKSPFNAEVNQLSVSSCGMYLCTVDCCWTPVERVNLSFWHFDPSCQKFTLNTIVDTPHKHGLNALKFQENRTSSAPLLLSCGNDKSAKIWFLDSSWSCKHSIDYRRLNCLGGAWSADGSVIALAFEHILTVWDREFRLRTTLLNEKREHVTRLEFGKGTNYSPFLFTATDSAVSIWNLMSLECTFTIQMTGCLNVLCDPVSGLLALITKDKISLVDPVMNVVKQEFVGVNATGGAVYVTSNSKSMLYFITYNGLIRSIGSKIKNAGFKNMKIFEKPKNPLFLTKANTVTPMEITAEVPGSAAHDIETILSVPLHAIPSNSALVHSFLANRLLALPKSQVVTNLASGEDKQEETSKQMKKIKQVFTREKKSSELDLNSFCKLLKEKKSK